ncbi:MAG: DegT/DnrJ/EryC1/StrS family aminotransferase [Armatimonadetes bacterium]|nr:DegT/DnrJ/EryC1/StrS family aminotransferase [Armatimonadota bacterium]
MAIPLANPTAQYLALKDEISTAVRQVLDSGQFILGPNVAGLESEIAAVCEAGYGIAVNSGTDAIVIALAACGIGPGDEVITTPFTFVATTEAILMVGAKPVYADIDPNDFNLDPAKVEDKITDRTRAILPVHLYGQCANTDKFEAIARKHNLKVIYDGAQAIGAARKGRGMGAYGDASTLSFYPTKNLGGCGDGGMVLTCDENVAAMAKSLRSHGQGKTYFYEHVGYCSRLDEIQAAILRVKLKKIQQWNDARRANAAYYIDAFAGLPLQLPASAPENYHIYHQFTVRLAKRDELKAKLQERGVGSGVYYPGSLHLQPAYLNMGYKEGDLPESERAAREVLSLPILPELSAEDREIVAKAVREAVKELV